MEQNSHIGISVITITHYSSSYLELCLPFLVKALEDYSFQIILYDNASKGEDLEPFRSFHPNIELIFSDDNLGFGKACNNAAGFAKYPILFFVNPDTLVFKHSVAELVNFLNQNEKAGVVGGSIFNRDGSFQPACRRAFPTPLSALYKVLGLDLLFPKSERFGQYNQTYLPLYLKHPVQAVSGSFFAIRKEVFDRVKGFDETFFLYGEDLDFCRRVLDEGYDNYYLPESSVIHFKGHSAKKKLVKSTYHFYLAMYLFYKKYHSPTLITKGLALIGLSFFILVGGVKSGLESLMQKILVQKLKISRMIWVGNPEDSAFQEIVQKGYSDVLGSVVRQNQKKYSPWIIGDPTEIAEICMNSGSRNLLFTAETLFSSDMPVHSWVNDLNLKLSLFHKNASDSQPFFVNLGVCFLNRSNNS